MTADERPIVGVMVHDRRVTEVADERPSADAAVAVNGRSVSQINAGGYLVTPTCFDGQGTFAALVQADGSQDGRTAGIDAIDGELALRAEPRARAGLSQGEPWPPDSLPNEEGGTRSSRDPPLPFTTR
jgi:hypothetical protein